MTQDPTLYRYWRAELKTPGSQPRNEVEQPIAGYWRADGARTKPSWPVAVWYDEDGTPHHKVGQSQKDGEGPFLEFLSEATWLRCVAVTHADYLVALDTGRWPSDGKHARHMDEAEKNDIDVSAGENAAPVEESLADQIKALAEKLAATPEPTTQEQANALSGHLDKMRALLKLAENKRVEEKQPFLDGGRDVDAKWQAIGEPGGNAYREGESRRKAFLKKEQTRLDEEAAAKRRRQQAAVDAENERIRLENEARFIEAAKAGAADVELVPEVTAPAAPIEPPRATAGSTFGRSTGLKKVTVVTSINYEVLAAHFITANDGDFAAYLSERAKKALRAKVTLPGVTTKEELQ